MSAHPAPIAGPGLREPAPTPVQLRARKLVSSGAVLLLAQALGWGAFYLVNGNPVVTLFEAALAILGVGILALARARRYRTATALGLFALYVAIVGFSLWLDGPTPAAPRTTHLFLLSVGLCAFYVLHDEPPWVRHGVAGVYFLTFLFFAGTHYAIPSPYAVPDSIRLGGSGLINTSCAVFVVLLMLYLTSTDRAVEDDLYVEMRDALAERRFVLHYQPQVDADRHVVGAEALLRWNDPRRGQVSPADFIPVAERTGFILSLGQWALLAACEQLALWQSDPRTRHLSLSVNVSAQQVRQPDFVAQVEDALHRTSAPAHRLKLELTESTLVHDIEDLIQKMQKLDARGVGFSLDDFGTGYSSLNYLKRLPLQQLKIDQTFVHDVTEDRNAAVIARTLIALGQSLDLMIVAEGIETRAQHEFLLREGCRVFQGYHFSRPLELAAFEAYLAQSPGAS